MTVLMESEADPASWPAAPDGLSLEAAALDSDALWTRIEGWIAFRWSGREVTWIVNGPGVWSPRLQPATITAFEVWDDGWTPAVLSAHPLGYELDDRTYRFTATVGTTDTPPPAVLEAYRRLAEYLADTGEIGRVAISGRRKLSDVEVESTRPTTWMGRAIHYSGAADLLRPWRQA